MFFWAPGRFNSWYYFKHGHFRTRILEGYPADDTGAKCKEDKEQKQLSLLPTTWNSKTKQETAELAIIIVLWM